MTKLENGSLLQETASVLFLIYLPDTWRKTALGRASAIKLIKNRFMMIKIGQISAFGNFPLWWIYDTCLVILSMIAWLHR